MSYWLLSHEWFTKYTVYSTHEQQLIKTNTKIILSNVLLIAISYLMSGLQSTLYIVPMNNS